jgi:prevent-host-death family protein
MRMGLREANQRFSKAIKAVKAGEEVVLTERGKPIAVITPVHPTESHARALRRLEAAGLVLPVTKPGPMPRPRWRRIRVKGWPLSKTIQDERDER